MISNIDSVVEVVEGKQHDLGIYFCDLLILFPVPLADMCSVFKEIIVNFPRVYCALPCISP